MRISHAAVTPETSRRGLQRIVCSFFLLIRPTSDLMRFLQHGLHDATDSNLQR
jgi:hypothetical protein